MANKNHLEVLKKGIDVWNKWRESNPYIEPDLSEVSKFRAGFNKANLRRTILRNSNLNFADFEFADLTMADLSGSDLKNANFCYSTLMDADLSRSNLEMAGFIDANLIRCNLKDANLTKTHLLSTNLSFADLSGTILRNAKLERAIMVGTNLKNADLSNCSIYGISAWDVKLDETNQKDLQITPSQIDVPKITTDNLELAQFIYLLLHNEKIRDIIDTITTKVVLILGRFTEKRKPVLDAIREELRKHDYVPVMFDFKIPKSRDTHETITTLARMSNFVIADITSPKSIPQELVSIVANLPSVPVIPLLKGRSKPWGMFDHIKKYNQVLPFYRYKNIDDLINNFENKIIVPAKEKVIEIRKK